MYAVDMLTSNRKGVNKGEEISSMIALCHLRWPCNVVGSK